MTKLAARIPFIYLYKLLALPCKLIRQYIREHTPAIVSYGFTKAELTALLALCHSLDANIFYANGIIVICKVASFFVKEVTALISDFFMERSYT